MKMIRPETESERKARISRARLSGHSGIPSETEKPRLRPSDIHTGIEFAAWIDSSAEGKTIYEIAGVCGSLDLAHLYVSMLGSSMIRNGSHYRLCRGCRRKLLPSLVRGHA